LIVWIVPGPRLEAGIYSPRTRRHLYIAVLNGTLMITVSMAS
jgi:hypothetical protein